MARKKPETWPQHRMGEYYGYNVFEDGSIELAPALTEQMRDIISRKEGLLDMQQGVTAFVAHEMQDCHKQTTAWWAKVFADLGLETQHGEGWTFDHYGGRLFKPPASCDRSGEASETRSGSTVGESAVGAAETPNPSSSSNPGEANG